MNKINTFLGKSSSSLSMKIAAWLTLLLIVCVPLSAQELSVKSMELLPNDATASMEDFQRQDLNGNYAGVVKVMLAVNGATFEGGGVLEQRKHMDGEYWVWLAKDSKRIKIHAPGYLPLELNFFNDYKIKVESKRTYKLVLTFAKGEREQTQKLTLRYTPADATVVIDDMMVEGQNGVYETTLPIGDHGYMVMRQGYAIDKGTFSLLSSAPKRLTVELEQLQAISPVTSETPVNVPVSQPAQPVTPTIQPATASSDASNKTFEVKGVSFTMVYVEGGTFTMGATKEQGKDAYSDEKPTHSVTLSSYFMGETEVTQALWEAVMGSTVQQQRDKVNKDWELSGEGSNHPMYYISWEECQEFVDRLNSLTGQQFKLPTEAQWEYAARGGKQGKGYKYSGSNTLGDVAWYGDNSGSSPHPVKTKSPNELGLYDMSGNVWEWCSDWYGDYSRRSQNNPIGVSSGSYRVYRGGSWRADARHCRVSSRDYGAPSLRNINLGLRLAL